MTAPVPEMRRLLADHQVEHLVNAYGYTITDLAAILDAAEALAAAIETKHGAGAEVALARWRELTGEDTP